VTAIVTARPVTRGTSRRGLLIVGLLVGAGVLIAVVFLSLALGTRDTPFGSVFGAIFSPQPGDQNETVIRELRVPRTVIGLVVGCALALAGAVAQGITRNPLADPGLLGVNSGASLFVVLAITLFGVSSPGGYIWFAFVGAAVAATVVYFVGSVGRGGATPITLALAGMAVTAIGGSVITLLLIGNTSTLDSYRFWQVGSLAARGLDTLAVLWPFLLVGAVLAVVLGRPLNLLAMGDDLATGLGQRVGLTRAIAAVAIVLLCGAGTALAGPIVFVGLVVPHLARAIAGHDYRWILAFSAILGPVLLLAADVVGRLVVRPGELEAGIVVALIGAPVMIAIVRRTKLAGL
jgi:iron complex transport system permease protein